MRRALCVGIDQYSFGRLQGCVSDAERVAALLKTHADGSRNFDCRTLLAPHPGQNDVVTRSKLREAVEALLKDRAEVALLHFSGHGTENNLDGYLVTQDAKQYDEGVAMSDVLKLANNSRAEEVVIVLDCCHSGHMGNAPALNNLTSTLREGVSVLTASRGDQVSVETNGGGLFTSLVVDALDGGAADLRGAVTVPSVYAFVEAALGAWHQRPLLKAHVAKLVGIRCCTPTVEPSTLRALPQLFSLPAEDLALSPAFEPSSKSPDTLKVDVFRKLQALHRVHLVVPVGCAHMYDAAMESKACRLTATGRYYWRLAHDGLI